MTSNVFRIPHLKYFALKYFSLFLCLSLAGGILNVLREVYFSGTFNSSNLNVYKPEECLFSHGVGVTS